MTKTLIIGGNRFLGPELVRLLLKQGHEITIFNRGNDYGQVIPPEIKVIKGDRREAININSLGTKEYDYVYDMCCFNPVDATNLLKSIKPTAHLVLLSTAAVYKKPKTYPLHENSTLGAWDSFGDYGTNKVLAENKFIDYATKHSLKLTIFRPVYLLGNMNYFDRENYYFSRISKGLPILIPGNGNALIQFSFLKETAQAFATIPSVQKEALDILNVAGNEYITLNDFVLLCADLANKKADLARIDCDKFGLDEEKFYDDLYPFPNLNFIVDNRLIREKYSLKFQPLQKGLEELYASWKKSWDGSVTLYEHEQNIINKLRG